MAKIQDLRLNVIAPDAPRSGVVGLYADSGGILKVINATGDISTIASSTTNFSSTGITITAPSGFKMICQDNGLIVSITPRLIAPGVYTLELSGVS